MTDESFSLLRLTNKQIKPAAEVLARAFQNYPVSILFLPDAEERKKRSPSIYRQLLRNGIKYGEVYATSIKMEGVALWLSPKSQKVSSWDRLMSGHFLTRLLEGRMAIAWQNVFKQYVLTIKTKYVPSRHWYLQYLGVDPVFQGQGHAGRLLRPMLARADREGVTCFLETQVESNVAFYEHFGFRVAEQGTIPGSNIKTWAMVKDNK
jgi:GNAT superfamily N-acetyltransferase